MGKLYWAGSSDIELNKVYKKNRICSVERKVYHGATRFWQGKTRWFIWLPLYLAIETDQKENCAGLHYFKKYSEFALQSLSTSNGSLVASEFSQCLKDLGIDKKIFFDSLDELKIGSKERLTLDTLVALLNPSKGTTSVKK